MDFLQKKNIGQNINFFVRVLYFISLLKDQFPSFIKDLFIGVELNLDLKTVSLHRMRYFKKDVTGNLTKKNKNKKTNKSKHTNNHQLMNRWTLSKNKNSIGDWSELES